MPKRPKPRWGHRPPVLESPFGFTVDQATRLAELVGLSDDRSVRKLHRRLNHKVAAIAAARFLIVTEVPASEQRAALRVLGDLAPKLLGYLKAADLSTRRAIFSGYPNVRLDDEADVPTDSLELFQRDISHLERLCRAIEEAPARVPREDGRPDISFAKMAAATLADIFEELTDTRFQVSEKSHRQESRQFVECGVRVIVPDATDANVRTALRHAAQVLNRQRKKQKRPQRRG